MGHPSFLQTAGMSNFCSYPSDTDVPRFCGQFPYGYSEACSLLSEADPVCYLAFQEDEAFGVSGLHASKCYFTC